MSFGSIDFYADLDYSVFYIKVNCIIIELQSTFCDSISLKSLVYLRT